MIAIAGIVFSCVAANHLGLVEAVERLAGRNLPIVSCPKCLTFWAVLPYAALHTTICGALATAFACAYAASWVELAMYFIDNQYLWLYGKISNKRAADNKAAAAADGERPEGAVPRLRKTKKT